VLLRTCSAVNLELVLLLADATGDGVHSVLRVVLDPVQGNKPRLR
jgi:hypothetical protein